MPAQDVGRGYVFAVVTPKVRRAWALAVPLFFSVILTLASPLTAASSTSTWLDRLNGWRTLSNVPALSENPTWSAGDYAHSVYMVKNDQVTHYELSSLPYYSVAGDTAAKSGNIEVNSSTSFTDDQAIDWWMRAPFHAMGMMDPRLTTTGFGSYREVKSGWDAGFTLDTIRGNSFTGGSYPVYFPGNGSTVPGATTYGGGEFPDPLQACPGYSAPTGLPVFIELGGNLNTSVTAHSFTGNGVPLAHCAIDSSNSSVGSYLYTRGGVILIPQQPLQPNVTYVVAMTVNGKPYTWTFNVSSSTAMPAPGPATGNLGGTATSGPAATTWSAYRTDVFIRGSNNALWHSFWAGSRWSPWEDLGGVLTSDPAAVAWGPNRIDIFGRGTDNQLWHKFWAGAWSNWEPLGGVLSSGPGVASWGSGRLDVFARGTDNQLWHKLWAGGWSNWEPLGGVLTSDPAAVSWGSNRIDIFARGTDNGLWHKWWYSGWTAWESLGGGLTSGPSASSCAAGHLDVFALGTASNTYRIGFNGAAWSAWGNLAIVGASDPASVCPSGQTVQLYDRLVNNTVALTTVQGT